MRMIKRMKVSSVTLPLSFESQWRGDVFQWLLKNISRFTEPGMLPASVSWGQLLLEGLMSTLLLHWTCCRFCCWQSLFILTEEVHFKSHCEKCKAAQQVNFNNIYFFTLNVHSINSVLFFIVVWFCVFQSPEYEKVTPTKISKWSFQWVTFGPDISPVGLSE